MNNKDELLQCLVIFTKLNNNPYTAEALTKGLPDSGKGVELFSINGSKSLFSRAANRAGFSSELVRKDLDEISPLVMPCILILKNKKACILKSIKNDKAVIITPQMPTGFNEVDLEYLKQQYLGYAFYIKKQFANASDEAGHLLIKNDDHWFWGTLKKSKKIYQDVIIASLLINIFVLASPLFTMNVYDRVVPNNAVETLIVLATGVCCVFFLDMFLKLLRTYFLEIAGKKSDIVMSSILFEHVMDMKLSYRPKSVGSFAQNLKEFETVRNFFSSASISAIVDLPFAIIFLAVTFFIGGYLVVVPVIFIVIIIIYALIVKNPLQRSIESTFQAAAIKNGILIESLNSIETIKTMGSASNSQWQWEEATGEIANRSLKSKILTASISTVTALMVQLDTVFVIIMGVFLIQHLQLTLGGLIAVVILSSRAIAPMGQVAALAANYEQTKTAYGSLVKIMQTEVERPKGKKFIRRDTLNGDIEFKNVNFKYPDSQSSALSNINFKIKAGEKVGLIGRNGSGKTTIEKLILGLYKPESGAVLIDGIDINQIDPADLRKNIGYVPQDVILFKGTVKQNIVCKAPWADDMQIIRAAKISGVDEYVNSHPLGFDMPVFERGEGISGGQRQSIALSRAFLLDSPIILLDEPTNSLDNTAENRLKQNLSENLSTKTLILVTHKTSLLDLVDRLIVIDDGNIVLDGEKNEVLAKLMGK